MRISVKKTIFSLGFIACFFGIRSQGNFVKGYMINAKGDTVKGEVKINPKKEFDNFTRIAFKDEAGVQKNYKPTKIKGYGFDNNHFIAKGEGDEALFYQRLTNGDILLYKSSFESFNMNQTTKELAYFLYREGDKKMTDVKETKFKKQIQEWMSGSAGFANDYADTEDKKFNAASAIDVINKYNEWKKSN